MHGITSDIITTLHLMQPDWLQLLKIMLMMLQVCRTSCKLLLQHLIFFTAALFCFRCADGFKKRSNQSSHLNPTQLKQSIAELTKILRNRPCSVQFYARSPHNFFLRQTRNEAEHLSSHINMQTHTCTHPNHNPNPNLGFSFVN